MFVILKMNPAEYGCKMQVFPTAPQCAISRSDVVCLLTGMKCGVRQLKLHDCQIQIGHYSRDRTSAGVCLK